MKKRVVLLFVLPLLLLSRTLAVGSGDKIIMLTDTNKDETTTTTVVTPAETPIPEEPKDDNIQTITISYLYETVIDEKIATYQNLHPEIKIVAYNRLNDSQRYFEQLKTKLMVNEADDIIEVSGIQLPYYEYADMGLLVDLYGFINEDPTFVDNYSMNLLSSMEYKGGLYAFPKGFDIEFVAVNKNASGALTDEFASLSSINYMDMVALKEDHGITLSMELEFSLRSIVYQSLVEYIDFENKSCDFDNERFISMLEMFKAVDEKGVDGQLTGGSAYIQTDDDLSAKYLYRKTGYNESRYFIGYESVVFANPVPITNTDGKVIVDPVNAYAIYEGSEYKQEAWKFIKFLSSSLMVSKFRDAGIPVNKIAFERLYWILKDQAAYLQLYDVSGLYKLDGVVYQYIDAYFDRIRMSSEMPVRLRFPYFEGAELIIGEVDMYIRGLISAKQAAANIQNKMSIKLSE